MNTTKRIAALALALALMTTLFTACNSAVAPPSAEPNVTDGAVTGAPIETNEDITNRYSGLAYLERVSPVLVTVTDYDIDDGEGGTRNFTMQRMHGTWDGLRGVYQKADWGDILFAEEVAFDNKEHYGKFQDGSLAVRAFTDDAYASEVLPWLNDVLTFGEEEKLVSVETVDSVTTIITESSGGATLYEEHGISGGTSRFVHTIDVATDRLTSITSYYTPDGGEEQLIHTETYEFDITLWELPDFVATCRDTSDLRTVNYHFGQGKPGEKVLTFKAPHGVGIALITLESYEYFFDADYTEPYVKRENELDVLDVYLREIPSEE
jgi:hypothetical protein